MTASVFGLSPVTLALAALARGAFTDLDTMSVAPFMTPQPYQLGYLERARRGGKSLFAKEPCRAPEPSRKTKGRTGARARVEARNAWNARRR